MNYQKPNLLYYRLTQVVSGIVAGCIFKRKLLRNEIKDAKGPFIVIANHQAAYDFVNLIGTCKRPMSFVISNSFYQSLPIKDILDKLAVIPKQQFQTSVSDMKKIRAVIQAGEPVVIYPAGLMCEDGLSTPIPVATYKLFSKEELETLDPDTIREKTEQALLFDAYREQEQLMAKYKKGSNLHGLENVLYRCPHCGEEFTIAVKDDNTLFCQNCGYAETSDEYGFLHKTSDVGPEIRYVSDWSIQTYRALKEKLSRGEDTVLSAKTAIHMVDPKKKKYVRAGEGTVTLSPEAFLIEGTMHGAPFSLTVPTTAFPTLPFTPGKHMEIQDGQTIYRCVLDDGNLAMKFINMVKIFHELNIESKPASTAVKSPVGTGQ